MNAKIFRIFAALAIAFAFAACDDTTESGSTTDTLADSSADTLEETTLDLTNDTTANLELSYNISECGGFSGGAGGGEGEEDMAPEAPYLYCDAEILFWSYDAATGIVTFHDARAMLNCCGEHSVVLEELASSVSITLVDEPEDLGRCNCTCAFDYDFTLSGVSGDSIAIELYRLITDSSDVPEPLYAGTIDLTMGSGSIVINDQPNAMCNPDG